MISCSWKHSLSAKVARLLRTLELPPKCQATHKQEEFRSPRVSFTL
jgi:hypothetical protein